MAAPAAGEQGYDRDQDEEAPDQACSPTASSR